MDKWKRSTAILLSLVITNVYSSNFDIVNNYNVHDYGFFDEFNSLMEKSKPLDFGNGYPDFSPSPTLENALANVATSKKYELNQYPHSRGHPRLRKAIATLFSGLTNRTLNPEENVVVTVGALQALYAIFQSHTNPGDEWIIFEPYYHMFDSAIKAARGVPRYISLIANKTTGTIKSSDFKFDKQHLARLFNERTKGILVNTPHNPTGKIFDYEELTYIAELAKKWDVIVIFDEVYQFLIYNNAEHCRLGTFPEMYERTITIGSAGKLFSATGYRIGWAYGPKKFIDHIKTVLAVTLIGVPTPLQEAVAVAIEVETENFGKSNSYLEQIRREGIEKRNHIYETLKEADMTPVFSESGYFTLANWTTMVDSTKLDNEFSENSDYSFVRWMTKNTNVFAYPMSHAYGDNIRIGESYVRFTMMKRDVTLEGLRKLFKKWKSRQNSIAK